ncbi:MAG TPA: hypothetical protein VF598_14910 [Hymenobacter sp.]
MGHGAVPAGLSQARPLAVLRAQLCAGRGHDRRRPVEHHPRIAQLIGQLVTRIRRAQTRIRLAPTRAGQGVADAQRADGTSGR